MKIRNIFGLTLAATLAFGACAEKDTTAVDQWLGEKFNQEILWDVDSLAFRRTNWESQELASGVQIRKSSIKMWESVQSVSYITFSPVLFNTGLGYTGSEGTVGEIAENYDDVLFAINAGSFANGKSADYLKINGEVKNGNVSDMAEALFGLNTKQISEDMALTDVKLTADFTEHESFQSSVATGPMIVRNGNAVKSFPEGEFFDTRMARSFVGVTAAGNCVFGIIDGGNTGHADGATVAEAAVIAQLMGLKTAALLGCGDETTVWSKKDGVINAPSAGSAQKVGSVIYVAKGSVTVNGDGSKSNPYIIDNHVHMMLMRSLCQPNSTNYFRMEKDVDMTDVKLWTPLNYDDPYTRIIHFDGNGKTISNFAPESFVADDQATPAGYASLFGVLYGSCKNLTVKNAKVIVPLSQGSATGVLGGFVGSDQKEAVVENVKVIDAEVQGGRDLGLFGGQARDASIKNCFASGKITAGSSDVGGFIGRLAGKFTIENCSSDVYISAGQPVEKNWRYAGLLGFCATIGGTDLERDKLTVKKCYTTGTILNDSQSVQTAAGLIGYVNTPTSSISECYTTLSIEGGRTSADGPGGNMQCCGGIVGIVSVATECSISNCYSTCEKEMVTGQKSAGIAGVVEKGLCKIENCYSDYKFNGYSGLAAIVGTTTANATLDITKCIAWNPYIKVFRTSGANHGSGAIVGNAQCKCTITNCLRNPALVFTDPFGRTLGNHGDIAGAQPENIGGPGTSNPDGTSNQNSFDGMPAESDNLNEVAKSLGWSVSFWDFSGSKPQLSWAL